MKSLQKIQFLELHLLQIKHLLHHKLLQNNKMKLQSWILSPLYNLQLQMMSMMRMKLKCSQWAIKELSMKIVLKRTPIILFQQKRLPLAPQLVSSLAPVCQKGGEGEIYLRSLPSLPKLLNLEDGDPTGRHTASPFLKYRWGIHDFCSRWQKSCSNKQAIPLKATWHN